MVPSERLPISPQTRRTRDEHRPPFDVEAFIPKLPFIRLDQLARHFSVSVEHLYRLVIDGEIEVPQELLDSAPSRPCIRVPRASVVDFVRRRSSRRWRFEAKRRKKRRS